MSFGLKFIKVAATPLNAIKGLKQLTGVHTVKPFGKPLHTFGSRRRPRLGLVSRTSAVRGIRV